MSVHNNKKALKQSILTGGCLCGLLAYQVDNQFSHFYLCHCQQCRKLTGSAFSANIFTAPENIKWLTGCEKLTHYEHPERAFSKAFCSACGCALPFINKSGKSLIIPAGSLFDKIKNTPEANIFVSEQAHWLAAGLAAKKFSHFPREG